MAALPEAEAKAFCLTHHYARSWPAARLRYGMIDRDTGGLCGLIVLGVPMHHAVLTGPFPLLEPYRQSLELSRVTLLDTVAPNGESWLITQALRRAAEFGVRGVVAFADPVPRWRETPHGRVLVKPGHIGGLYQACSALYTGLATPRTLIMLPDATVLTARAAAKLTAGERGARGVTARLLALGATPPHPGRHPAAWLQHALAEIGATRIRHPGNHRYLIKVGGPRQRCKTVIAYTGRPYPSAAAPRGAVPAPHRGTVRPARFPAAAS
ncbi:hypothetical protein [Actinoplanes sp. NPDC026619]|uniref:Mom family adenine methylcarbamoylation protein n=1 Tax=Actinoplanes sp. NPDC026619 TaxID=3155798 RepID=UPI0033DE1B8E